VGYSGQASVLLTEVIKLLEALCVLYGIIFNVLIVTTIAGILIKQN